MPTKLLSMSAVAAAVALTGLTKSNSAAPPANQKGLRPEYYQARVTGDDCLNDGACAVTFPAVPPGMTLAVKFVSCVTETSLPIARTSLFAQQRPAVYAVIAPAQSYQAKGLWQETYSTPVLLYVPAPDKPVIEFLVTHPTGTFSEQPSCFVSGELKPN